MVRVSVPRGTLWLNNCCHLWRSIVIITVISWVTSHLGVELGGICTYAIHQLHFLYNAICDTVISIIWKLWNASDIATTLLWRHNGHSIVSNHQPHDCLLNHLFRRRSKLTPKLRVTGLCVGNSPGTGEFPAQMASYAEKVSIWWRHNVNFNQMETLFRVMA